MINKEELISKITDAIDYHNEVVKRGHRDYTEKQELQERINNSIKLLSIYKHHSRPTEEQNKENEDIVRKVYKILKGDDK